MGITSLRAWIVAASLLSICSVSHAAGLGKLTVLSALGEPLNAEIDLVAEKNEVGSLGARLASPDVFDRAGLAYSNLLTGVKVSVEKRAGGDPYVKVTSNQPVNEPFVDLLIELTWSSGRISREFTVLLDPPGLVAEREKQKAAAAEVKAAPAAEPQPSAAEPIPAPPPAEPAATPGEAPAATTAQAPAEAKPEEAKPEEAKPQEAKPAAPVETIGGTQPTLLGEGGSQPASAAATADAYGPVKSGDTLHKIASANKPADVSLDQLLVLLVRDNPDAFVGNNMNRLKTGKILKLPAADEYATLSEADARKEVKLQARDWRAYREKLAAAAGEAAPPEQPAQQAASGKVGTAAPEKSTPAAEPPKEVLKLSKNEPAAGAGGDAKPAARVHALEEEVIARDKAVKEANERVAKLEKQIKDLQSLLELKNKGMADLQKPATPAPAATPAVPPAAATSAPKPAAPPAAMAPAAPATPAAPPATATPAPKPAAPPAAMAPAATPPAAKPGPEVKPATPAPTTPAPAPPRTESAPAPSQPAPTPPKPAAAPKPAPVPEPGLLDQVLGQPAYLGAAIGVLIIIGALAVRAVKRRRESKSDAEESGPARAAPDAAAPAAVPAAAAAGAQAPAASAEVDPVAEAEIFLAYGRDAQAEELLKEALEVSPNRYDVHLKLLQIYANRKDVKSFEKVARELQQGSGGSGEIWDQAVVLGYQVDPENPRYAAGKSAAGAVMAGAAAAAAENVDFNIGSEDSTATTTDIDLGEGGSPFDRAQIIDPAAEPAHDSTVSIEAPPATDFNVDLPVTDAPPAAAAEMTKSEPGGGLDFDIDLNSLAAPAASPAPAPAAAEAASGGLDFDMSGLSLDAPAAEPQAKAAAPEIDLSGISLDLGTQTMPAASPTGKDDHWYDVQTKFDLAKAYQEMGDKDGAREILKEVLQEGDNEQKAAAQSVLASLDA
ncbi:MAG TPA: FimV/HubP family polar landmark protein [Burkholderiales bacterium]|nr:FimV/HubP family polar landmark protein [Burkholderiales bacterium]